MRATSTEDSVRSLSEFQRIFGTAGTCIAPTWRGLYMQRVEAFRNNKSGTKYCMLAISQKKAELSGSSTTRNELRSRRSARSSRSTERAAPLWTARRKHIAALHGSACHSRFAALDAVRRRFTASAPALRAAPLCHACRLRIRRIEITRNRPGLGETVAPQKNARSEGKQARPGPSASGRTKEKYDGCKRNGQTKRSTGRELDQMPPLGWVRDFPLALLWRVPENRERATGRERCLGSEPQRLGQKAKRPYLSGRKE